MARAFILLLFVVLVIAGCREKEERLEPEVQPASMESQNDCQNTGIIISFHRINSQYELYREIA